LPTPGRSPRRSATCAPPGSCWPGPSHWVLPSNHSSGPRRIRSLPGLTALRRRRD